MARSKPSPPTNQTIPILTLPKGLNLAPLALLFLSGSLVLLWFVILSGVTHSTPLRQTYFLRASTAGIQGARPVSQWTYFQVCGLDNADCGPARPGLPLGDAWATDASGAPPQLIGSYGGGTTSYSYWYMWRFGWVFFLIALFFESLVFLLGLIALCSRIGSAVTGLLAVVALVFFTVAVSLMTYVSFSFPFLRPRILGEQADSGCRATFVKMRNVFHSEGRDAQIGSYAFGFAWGAWAALLVATVLFFIAARKRRDAVDPVMAATPSTRRRRWALPWRRGGVRSVDGHRVKEEYA